MLEWIKLLFNKNGTYILAFPFTFSDICVGEQCEL